MRLATFELVANPETARIGALAGNRMLDLAHGARLFDLGAEPASTTPEQFLAFIRADNAKWAKLIKERGVVIEGGS